MFSTLHKCAGQLSTDMSVSFILVSQFFLSAKQQHFFAFSYQIRFSYLLTIVWGLLYSLIIHTCGSFLFVHVQEQKIP